MKTPNTSLIVGLGLIGLAAAWAWRTFFGQQAAAQRVVASGPATPLTDAAWQSLLTYRPVQTPVVAKPEVDVAAAWHSAVPILPPPSAAARAAAVQQASDAARQKAEQASAAEAAQQAFAKREADHQDAMIALQLRFLDQKAAAEAAAKADAQKLDEARVQALIDAQAEASRQASTRAAAGARLPISLWRFDDDLKKLLQPGDPGYNYVRGIDAPDVPIVRAS